MEPERPQSVKSELDPDSNYETVVVKEEHHRDDDSCENSPVQIKLEPETVISEDSSSFHCDTVQKEELELDDGELFEDDGSSASSSEGGHDSFEEGFESHTDFVTYQRRLKRVLLPVKSSSVPKTVKAERGSKQTFHCSECDVEILSRKAYGIHRKRHRMQKIIQEGIYSCDRCKKAFATPSALNRHTKKYKEGCPTLRVKYECKECDKSFITSTRLERHVLNHKKRTEIKQLNEVAKESTGSKPSFSEALGKLVWNCEECGKSLPCQNYHQKHMKRHDAIRNALYRCATCQKLFSEHRNLLKHEQTVHDKVERRRDPDEPREMTECPVCNKPVFKDGMKTHMRYHKYIEAERYKCEAFAKKCILDEHRKRQVCGQTSVLVQLPSADERRTLTCLECGKTFYSRNNLKTHFKRIHENKKQGLFQCRTCEQYYGSKSHLASHELTHLPRDEKLTPLKKEKFSEDPLNLICSECNKGGFLNRKSLLTHLKRVHENKSKGTYQCPHCQKVFGSRSNLLAHQQSHEAPKHKPPKAVRKEKPPENPRDLVCPECGKAFPSRKSLQTHLTRVHENKRKGLFQCGVCAKVFGSKSNLVQHRQCHDRMRKGGEDEEDDLSGMLLSASTTEIV